MTQWHANTDRSDIGPGVKLTVLSDHHVVRVVTADTLSIETPAGPRLSAMVLDRTGGSIRLALSDGQAVELKMLADISLHPPGQKPQIFSSQVWVVH